MVRHEADYRAQLELGDDVEVRTWVDEAARASRGYALSKSTKRADKPSAQIKSNWVML